MILFAWRAAHLTNNQRRKKIPEVVQAIEDETYVNDVLFGVHDVTGAKRKRDQLIGLIEAGGCEVKKWVSNSSSLLEDLPSEDKLRPTFS